MARPESLVPGNCYFLVGFHDNDLLFPYIETLRYVRYEEVEGLGPRWMFDQPNEPPPDEQTDSSNDFGILALPADQLHDVLDFDGLATRLREISRLHPLSPVRASAIAHTSELPPEVPAKVDHFFAETDCASLVMTIRFTDDGVSLRRTKSGYTVGFFMHPFQESDEEEKVRKLFASRKVEPSTDYLADRGRTRILEYPISSDRREILELLRLLFTTIYALRVDDELDFSFIGPSAPSKKGDER